MGQDKAWIEFRGKPLIQHVIDRASKRFSKLMIAGQGPKLAKLNLPLVADRLSERSTLTGIHALLSCIETKWCFVVACDMPFINVALADHLFARRADRPVVAARSNRGIEPLHALYSKAGLAHLEKYIRTGNWGAQQFCSSTPATLIDIPEEDWKIDDRSPFTNMNTPDDLSADP